MVRKLSMFGLPLNSSVASPICQEGQSERTFPIFPLFPDFFPSFSTFPWFSPSLFPIFGFFFRCQGGPQRLCHCLWTCIHINKFLESWKNLESWINIPSAWSSHPSISAFFAFTLIHKPVARIFEGGTGVFFFFVGLPPPPQFLSILRPVCGSRPFGWFEVHWPPYPPATGLLIQYPHSQIYPEKDSAKNLNILYCA